MDAFNRNLEFVESFFVSNQPTGENDAEPSSATETRTSRRTAPPSFMLKSCYCVEKLSLQMGKAINIDGYNFPDGFSESTYWFQYSVLNFPWFPSVKVIEVSDFRGIGDELRLQTLFVNKCSKLERMSISIFKSSVAEAETLYRREAERLSGVQKVSVNASVVVQ